jgi:hypothetical protein
MCTRGRIGCRSHGPSGRFRRTGCWTTALELLAELEVVGVFEEAGVDEVPEGLAQEHRYPPLVLVDAQSVSRAALRRQ